jgi:hypothetical protein
MMKLELANGNVFEDPSTAQVKEALDLLVPGENNTLILYKSPTSTLRFVTPHRSRYYIYVENVNTYKQSMQPVSLHMAKRIAEDFAKGKRRWHNGIRFEESFRGAEGVEKPKLEELNVKQLELRKKRVERGLLIPVGFTLVSAIGLFILEMWFQALAVLGFGLLIIFLGVRVWQKLKKQIAALEHGNA